MSKSDAKTESLRLYSLHSQKGGVGKTSLAIAIAGLEAVQGRRVLFLDVDLTGTCVADALSMPADTMAPDAWFNNFLLADPDAFLNLTALKRQRRGGSTTAWSHYVLQASVGKAIVDVMPSTPNFREVRRIVPNLPQEPYLHFYAERIEAILSTAVNSLGYDAVVMDLPPGLWGLSEAVLGIAADGEAKRDIGRERTLVWRALVVTTTDKMDYRAAFPAVWYMTEDARRGRDSVGQKESGDFAGMPWLWFNKASIPADAVQLDKPKVLNEAFQDLRSPEFFAQRVAQDDRGANPDSYKEDWKKFVSFQDEQIRGHQAILPLVDGFRIAGILDSISSANARGFPRDEGLITGWVHDVGSALGLLGHVA